MLVVLQLAIRIGAKEQPAAEGLASGRHTEVVGDQPAHIISARRTVRRQQDAEHGTSSVSFAACIEAARTAFPLFGRRLHFDHSFAACIEVPHRAPAFACIFTFHLQRASWPPAIPFPLFCSQHCHEPCLGGHGCILHAAAGLPEEALWSNASAQFICTLQLWCPRRSCGRMHPHSSSALCSRAAQGGSVVYLWSNASAEFICTMQPLRPSKDEAQACRYGVQLHSAALLPERLGQG